MNLLHLRMTADDSEIISIAHQCSLQAAVLTFNGFELQGALYQRRHLMRREGLFDVVKRTAFDSFDRYIERAMRGHHDHLRIGISGFDMVQ